MIDFVYRPENGWEDFVRVVQILRSPGGCPWDREQTHRSIRDNLIEECCEAAEAIDTGDMELLREELGDVLLQVFLHARIAEEAGQFTLDDVVDGIARKLIHRHPHVFGAVEAETAEQVLQNWDEIKRADKGHASQAESMRAVCRGLPGFMRAEKLWKRAEKAGLPVQAEPITGEALGQALLTLAMRAHVSGLSADKALNDALDGYIEEFAERED